MIPYLTRIMKMMFPTEMMRMKREMNAIRYGSRADSFHQQYRMVKLLKPTTS
jgi:hypothetical protein